MEIPVPAGATRVTRLRIHGTENAGRITIRLWRAKRDSGDILLEQPITTDPFNETFAVPNGSLGSLENNLEGLALEVEATNRSDIWFIAAEFT